MTPFSIMSDTAQEFIEDLQKLHDPYCYIDSYILIEQSGMKQSHIPSLKMHVTCTGVFRQHIICHLILLLLWYAVFNYNMTPLYIAKNA